MTATAHDPDWRCYARGCRIQGCRDAWRRHFAEQRRETAYGRRTPLLMIDATGTLATFDALLEAGYTKSAITRSCGVSDTTIDRARRDGTIRRDAAARIAAFTPQAAKLLPRSKIDGTGTRRRLRALHAIGWTYTAIAGELGCSVQNVRSLVLGLDSATGLATVATASAVADLYERGWRIAPEPSSNASAAEQRRAVARAHANGWAVPAAWDNINDPGEQPGTVTRIERGNRPVADTAEDVEFILEQDPCVTSRNLAYRLGFTDPNSVQTALTRAGRTDLLATLARNAELAS